MTDKRIKEAEEAGIKEGIGPTKLWIFVKGARWLDARSFQPDEYFKLEDENRELEHHLEISNNRRAEVERQLIVAKRLLKDYFEFRSKWEGKVSKFDETMAIIREL